MDFARRTPRSRRTTAVEELEARLCLSDVPFAEHVITESEVAVPVAVYTADLDGDRDMDILSISVGDTKIVWYENTDGKGTFGSQRLITAQSE